MYPTPSARTVYVPTLETVRYNGKRAVRPSRERRQLDVRSPVPTANDQTARHSWRSRGQPTPEALAPAVASAKPKTQSPEVNAW